MAARGDAVAEKAIRGKPITWPELDPIWQAFRLLLAQTAGEMSRAICGQDIAIHMEMCGVRDPIQREMHYLGVLALQEELRVWREAQKETDA